MTVQVVVEHNSIQTVVSERGGGGDAAAVAADLAAHIADAGLHSGARYIHTQAVADTTWTVNHGLNVLAPGVVLLDNLGLPFEATIDYVDADNLTVTILTARSGSAYID